MNSTPMEPIHETPTNEPQTEPASVFNDGSLRSSKPANLGAMPSEPSIFAPPPALAPIGTTPANAAVSQSRTRRNRKKKTSPLNEEEENPLNVTSGPFDDQGEEFRKVDGAGGGGDRGAATSNDQLLQNAISDSTHVPIKAFWKLQRTNFMIRAKLFDLFLFLPTFFVLCFLCYHQYTARSQNVFYGNDAMAGQFMTDKFPTLNSTRPLRPGEVDKFHVIHTFEKLYYAEDWKVWFDSAVIGFLWDNSNPAESTPRNIYNYASGMQAVKVGAMQVRVIRTGEKVCGGILSTMARRLGYQGCIESFSIFSPSDSLKDDFGPMRYQECDPVAFIRTEGTETFYWCDGNVIDIPFSGSYNDAITISNQLHNNTFSILRDPHVRLISVEMFLYFPQTDTLSHYQLLTELPTSGSVITSVHLNSVPMFNNLAYAVVMILAFFGMAFMTLFREAATQYSTLRFGVGKRVGYFLTWVPLPVYTFIFIARMLYASQFELKPNMDSFPTDQLSLVSIAFVERHVLAVCLLALFARLMSLMSIFPMLRIVTRTIKGAFIDLAALICVFIVIFVTYALAGTILYSNSSLLWRNYPEAFGQTVLWVLGHSDYENMRKVNIPATIFFFWSYTILVVFVLLNFFVGVLEYALGNTLRKEGLDEMTQTSDVVRRELKRLWILGKSLLRRDYPPIVDCAKSLFEQQKESIESDIFAKESDKEAALHIVNAIRVYEFPRVFGRFTSNGISLEDLKEEYERRKAVLDASPLLDKYDPTTDEKAFLVKTAAFKFGELFKRGYWWLLVAYPDFDEKFAKIHFDLVKEEHERQRRIAERDSIIDMNIYERCIDRWNSNSLFAEGTDAEKRDLHVQVAQLTFAEMLSVLDPTLKLNSNLKTDVVETRIKAWIRDPASILEDDSDVIIPTGIISGLAATQHPAPTTGRTSTTAATPAPSPSKPATAASP